MPEVPRRVTSVTFTSSELLRLLATTGSHIVRETAAPRFAADAWVIKAADGSDLEVELGGYAFHPVQVSDEMLSDLEGARRIALDSFNGVPVYRLRQPDMELATAA